ncbi:hypothetical protein AcW1_005222 [Taiwanofungus camphoratus]|nr:hypothetical protein AcW2_003992 [Antrodia cinnamomea]KAI0933388.1 hypothetical protein AcV5_005545 [Antrodia cinnamomea]KAI0956577.1 hypothetical protein AcW1_005222 [Antrodia cinnamomea]
MPGRRNPFQIAQITGGMQAAIRKLRTRPKSEVPDPLSVALCQSNTEHKRVDAVFVDLTIHFIRASGLPKMDVVGSADPYFVAKIDNKVSFVSTVKPNTLSPEWNEVWKIKNVPNAAILFLEVLDKDNGNLTDDYIGQLSTTVHSGIRELKIEDHTLKRHRGTFWLTIDTHPSEDAHAHLYPYTFDGPIRFSRHFSPTVGRLVKADHRLYSTWKVYIKGVHQFFGDQVQPWNREQGAARSIFQGPASPAVRSMIQSAHRMLYARTAANDFGVINGPDDVFHLLHGHAGNESTNTRTHFTHRIKPAVYTYIIAVEDDSFRFSETGAKFLVNMASKHALHSNCAETVRYSGEFHPRPECGWENFNDEIPDESIQWELVIDNDSGTYTPDPSMLPALKGLLEYNFPGFLVVALHHTDLALKQSRDACRAYALSQRGINEDELQPHSTFLQHVQPETH